MTVELAVHGACWAEGAVAQAKDFVKLDRLAEGSACCLRLGLAEQVLTTNCLTRLRAAQGDGVPSRGSCRKVVIKRHHTVHLGNREIQHVSYHRDIALSDVAALVHDLMQDGKKGPPLIELPFGNGSHEGFSRGLGTGGHRFLTWNASWGPVKIHCRATGLLLVALSATLCVMSNDRTFVETELSVRRLPEYQVFDESALHSIVDEALIAHVGVVRDGKPVVLPFACARDGDAVILHGSTGGGVLRISAKTPIAVEITHVDGLVYARSLFESSMHYRSAVILGEPEVLKGDQRVAALNLLSEHLFPGRGLEVRDHTTKELAATLVLRLSLARASVKVSLGPADDPKDGESREVWAGVVPLRTVAGQPIAASDVPEEVPTSASALRAVARHRMVTD